QIEDRLIEELELTVGERLAQIDLQSAAQFHLGIHFRLEEPESRPPVRFGALKPHIGVLEKLVGVGPVKGCERDADARSDDDLMAVKIEGLPERLNQVLRQGGGA